MPECQTQNLAQGFIARDTDKDMPSITLQTDAEGCIELVTPSVIFHLGYQPEMLIGKNLLDYTHCDSKNAVLELFQRMQEKEAHVVRGIQVFGQDGSYIETDLTGLPLLDKGNRFVGSIICLCNSGRGEVTGREIGHIEQAQASSEKYMLMADTSKEALLIFEEIGGEWICQEANAAASAYFGYGREEMIGKKLRDFFVCEAGNEYSGEAAENYPDCREVICRRKDGSMFPAEESGRDYQRHSCRVRVCVLRDITDLKRIEERLKQSKQAMQNITESMPDIIARYDRNCCRIYINPAVESKFGISRDCLIGKTIGESGVPIYGATKLERAIQTVFRTGKTVTLNLDNFGPGLEKYYTAVFVPEFAENGRMDTVLGIARDITEQKLAEKALRESEERYRFFIQSYHGIAFQGNMHYRPLLFEGAVEKITGYSVEEFMAGEVSWADIVHPEDLSHFRSTVVKAEQEPGFSTDVEFRIIRKDKEVRWVSGHISAIGNDEGKPCATQGTVIDITDRKNEEEARISSELQYKTLTENVPGAIYRSVLTPNNAVVILTDDIKDITGYPSSHFLNKPVSVFSSTVHPEDIGWLRKEFNQAVANRKIFNFEYRIIHADGRVRWVQERGQGVWEGNTLLWIDGLIMDITERKLAEEKIHHLTFHDDLTGLYNRAFFEIVLQRLDTEKQLPLSVIMGDLNGLKIVNDSMGHQAGDRLLQTAANCLKEVCRKDDFICRWGGDEFAIILPYTEENEAEKIGLMIKTESAEVLSDGIPISISIGTATKADSGQNIERVIKDAEDRMYRHKLLEGGSARSSIITVLRKTLESNTKETQLHTDRLKDSALAIGRALGLHQYELDKLVLLSKMHDIGKVSVPKDILSKTGSLNEEERRIIEGHCECGYRIVLSTPELAVVAEEILSHHEWYDGTGYPRGLRGEEIPLLSRILSVVDAFDVMTNGRPYKGPINKEEALAELCGKAGTQFDPHIVDVFINEVLT